MALGNSWTTIKSGSYSNSGATLTYYIEAKLSSQSVANNQSSVDTRARTVLSGDSPYMSSYNVHMSCTGCSSYDGDNSTIYSFGTQTVLTGSVTINHSADGTGTLSMSGACTGNLGMNINLSGSIALPTIPRASKPTASKTSMTLDGSDSVTIQTHRASASFTHTLRFTVGSNTVTVNNVGTSYTWTPGVAYWMPFMTSKSMTVTVSCVTYNGSTQIGSVQSCSFTLNVDASVYKPLINSVAHEDTNSTTVALTGDAQTYVKGKSNLSVTVSLGINNTDYNSTLASARIATAYGTAQNYTLSGTSQTITFSENGITSPSITVTVTDNRGVTATMTINLTLIPYDVPRLSAIEIKRVNGSDQESDTGVYLKYKLSSTVFWGSFGQVSNALKVYIRYKLPSAQNYSAWTLEDTIGTSGTAQYKSYEITGTCDGEYSSSTQFDVQLKVEDELGNAMLYARVLEGIPVYAWGADHFDVYGSFHIHDREDPSQYLTVDHNGYIRADQFTSASTSCAANSAGSVMVNVTVPSGYKFLSIAQVWSNGNVVPCYSSSSALNNGQITVWWRNPTSSAMTATFSVKVLFVR